MSKSRDFRRGTLALTCAMAVTGTGQTPPPRDLTQFSLEDLAKTRHAEFPDSQLIDHMLDRRSIFGKITWRF